MANGLTIKIHDRTKSAVAKEAVALCGLYDVTVEPAFAGEGKLVIYRPYPNSRESGAARVFPGENTGTTNFDVKNADWGKNPVYAVFDLVDGKTKDGEPLDLSVKSLVEDYTAQYAPDTMAGLRFAVYSNDGGGLMGSGDLTLKVVEPYRASEDQDFCNWRGKDGKDGKPPEIEIGTVENVADDQPAEAEVVPVEGEEGKYKLNLKIPQGPTGAVILGSLKNGTTRNSMPCLYGAGVIEEPIEVYETYKGNEYDNELDNPNVTDPQNVKDSAVPAALYFAGDDFAQVTSEAHGLASLTLSSNGNCAMGRGSIAAGVRSGKYDNAALGYYSLALGEGNIVCKDCSIGVGRNNIVGKEGGGRESTAVGCAAIGEDNLIMSGSQNSHVFGVFGTIKGYCSAIIGGPFENRRNKTDINGNVCISIGGGNYIGKTTHDGGDYDVDFSDSNKIHGSIALGTLNTLTEDANYSIAIGYDNATHQYWSYILGRGNTISQDGSDGTGCIAIGRENEIAGGNYNFAIGRENEIAGGNDNFAIGSNVKIKSDTSNAVVISARSSTFAQDHGTGTITLSTGWTGSNDRDDADFIYIGDETLRYTIKKYAQITEVDFPTFSFTRVGDTTNRITLKYKGREEYLDVKDAVLTPYAQVAAVSDWHTESDYDSFGDYDVISTGEVHWLEKAEGEVQRDGWYIKDVAFRYAPDGGETTDDYNQKDEKVFISDDPNAEKLSVRVICESQIGDKRELLIHASREVYAMKGDVFVTKSYVDRKVGEAGGGGGSAVVEFNQIVPETSEGKVTLKPVDGKANWVNGTVGVKGELVREFEFNYRFYVVYIWESVDGEDYDDMFLEFKGILNNDNSTLDFRNTWYGDVEAVFTITKPVTIEVPDGYKDLIPSLTISKGANLNAHFADVPEGCQDLSKCSFYCGEIDISSPDEDVFDYPQQLVVGDRTYYFDMTESTNCNGEHKVHSLNAIPHVTLPDSTDHARSFSLALATDAEGETEVVWEGGDIIEAFPGAKNIVPGNGEIVFDVKEVAPGKMLVNRAPGAAGGAVTITGDDGTAYTLGVDSEGTLEVRS